MRLDKIKADDVCNFICGGSHCNETCCMIQVLGKCYAISEHWRMGEPYRSELLRVIRWRIKHGERNLDEAEAIGVTFTGTVV